MPHQELYDKISRVLTEYEYPEECFVSDWDIMREMYAVLVQVQNEMFTF